MSRRNTRQGKARRRAERGHLQVTGRERKRPSTSDPGPRAVEDQAVQAAPRPGGPGSGNSDDHGSELRSDADGGLTAAELDAADLDTDADLENADLDDLSDLDPDDADLQAALADEDLADISDVADWPKSSPATSTGRKYRMDLKTPGTPRRPSRPRRRTRRPRPRVRRAPRWSRSPRITAVRTRRSSSSVTTTMTFRRRK